MQDNVLEKFDELFKDADNLSIPQLESFVHEVLAFFESLRTVLITGTPDEKKEALNIATKLQKKLEELATKAMEKSGMGPDQLKNFLSNPGNFTPTEWKSYKNVENEISEYKDVALKPTPRASDKPKKKSSSKTEPWRKI